MEVVGALAASVYALSPLAVLHERMVLHDGLLTPAALGAVLLGWSAIERAAPLHVTEVRARFVDVLSASQLESLDEICRTVLAALDAETDRAACDDGDDPDGAGTDVATDG